MKPVLGELKQYIRDNNNHKVGAIVARKIEFIGKKVVCIVHSKVNPNYDDFDLVRMEEILESRVDFILDNVFDKKDNRIKSKQRFPHSIAPYYDIMRKRAEMYFKDAEKFWSYINFFEYVDFEESEITSVIGTLKDKITDYSTYKSEKVTVEGV
jgi:hypothetical protein